MDRLLITGVDGVVGANLAAVLAERCQVLGICHRQNLSIENAQTVCAESHDHANLAQLVSEFGPQWMIHCGLFSAGSWDLPQTFDAAICQREARTVKRLAELSAAAGSHLTVISTDAIFAGPWMFHDEASATAISARAAQVKAVESALDGAEALLLRTHAYGWSPFKDQSQLAERLWRSISTGTELAADGRRYATPILATDLAELIERAYSVKLQGLYHITGAERTSAHRFALQMANAFGLPSPRIMPVSCLEPTTPDAHEETSLNSRRARRALEMSMPLLYEGLSRFAQQAENGWRDRWRAGSSTFQSQAA